MANTLIARLKHGWNAFMNKDPTKNYRPHGYGYSRRIDRPRFSRGNEKSIVTSIFNKIATDVSNLEFRHIKEDKDGRYERDIYDGLNNCLTLEANKDQTARNFIQDIIISLFDEGCVALVPIDTNINPELGTIDIETIRTGKIVEWFPDYVTVRVYNDRTGVKENITISKKTVGIIENPFYSIINEPNSTLQRLIRKLNLLDDIDEQSGSGKLDLIIQLPYTIKSTARKEEANKRRNDIVNQLENSKFGIAYIDSTEHITQLNRPVENNLMKQIEYLTTLLYSQLGITQSVLDGTADEKTMLNYNNRIISVLANAIADEMKRKFLSKTARTQGHTIEYYNDPFKLVPVSSIADIADKLTRNEILSSNEIRGKIGFRPSSDPKADELRNKNLNQPNQDMTQYSKDGYAEENYPSDDIE